MLVLSFCRILSAKRINIEEREILKKEISLFGEIWIRDIKKSITPKLDTLLMVIPYSLEQLDGYIGALSEQNIERIHNLVNKEARRSHNICNPVERTDFILKVTFYQQSYSIITNNHYTVFFYCFVY